MEDVIILVRHMYLDPRHFDVNECINLITYNPKSMHTIYICHKQCGKSL